MKRIMTSWLLASFIASLLLLCMLAFAPKIEIETCDNFTKTSNRISFINHEDSAKIDALTMYDFEPIFLPTKFNKTAIAPRAISIDSLESLNSYNDINQSTYTDVVLSKKNSRSQKLDNIFHSNIREIMPYYKVQDKQNPLPQNDSINISVIEVASGENIISENLKIKDLDSMSNFFVPTEVFMNVSPTLTINIVDNITNPNLENSSVRLIREALKEAKIFQRINSGYYKLIISP